jgi:hypothetical protein
MKKIFNTYSFIILVGLGLSGCTKVIDVDLDDAEPNYVIEGEVNGGETIHTISISKTVDFTADNNFPAVSNALVTLQDNMGNIEILTEAEPGKYKTSNLEGVEGRTYTLTVSVDGKQFSSTSTMPSQVFIDTVVFIEGFFGPTKGKLPVPLRQDPAGIKNYYRFLQYKNGEKDKAIIIQDDEFSDGIVSEQPLFGQLESFQAEDTCKITLFCIDKYVHKYFFSLSQNSGGSASPANPISNISGGCLGYFTAQTKQTVEIIVP